MKVKNLISMFFIVLFLLFYCLLNYHLLNKRIETDTKFAISNYFKINYSQIDSYEFIKAISTKKNTFNVFVKVNNDYYNFYFNYQNQAYQLTDVSLDIPSYIK